MNKLSLFNLATKEEQNEKVNIGEQVWMAENLSYNANDSKCYDNKSENCDKYGRFYNWNTAHNASYASSWNMHCGFENMSYKSNYKNNWYSVRCLQN